MDGRIAVIGTGKMGEALLSGLLRAGTPATELVAAVRDPERGQALRERHGVQVGDAVAATRAASTLILAVKPQDMNRLLDQIGPHVSTDQLVVSAAAGITTASIEERLTEGVAVVRVMSNTPVLVDEAMSAISAGSHAGETELARTEKLFATVGQTIRVPESRQDAVTALSGSGPAYFYYLVEAMTDAGLLLGLDRAVAHQLVVQTAIGAAVMLRDSGEHPVTLREAVTSPAGTTGRAIRELENHGVRAAFLAALEAARDRSRELAAGRE